MAGYVKSEFISGLKIETSYQSKVFMDVSLDEISQGVSVKKNKEVQWLGTPVFVDPESPAEQYYMNGSTVKIDLEALLTCTTNGSGLNFILIKDNVWVPTGDAYITFSNVTFSK